MFDASNEVQEAKAWVRAKPFVAMAAGLVVGLFLGAWLF